MTARIVPRPKKDGSRLTSPSEETLFSPEPQALAYAVKNEIYVLPDVASGQSVQIAERSDWVRALAVYKGELVDAGNYRQILYTDTGGPIKQRSEIILSLAVHDGELVDAGSDGRIRCTETDEPIKRRPRPVRALAVYNGTLIDGGDYKFILRAGTEEPVKRRLRGVDALAVYNGKLVDASGTLIRYTETDNGKPIKRRPYPVWALVVLGGRLVDAGFYRQIIYTDTNDLILTADGFVTALCPIPLSLAERLTYGRSPK